MNVIAARRYVSARTRSLDPDEAETRRISYALKDANGGAESFAQAGAEMANLIDSPCVLVPVPDRNGNTGANTRLAKIIAGELGNGARVKDCLRREKSIESQCERHRKRRGTLRPEAHGIRRKKGAMFDVSTPVYCIDNVVTSGNTLAACKLAISTARGLVFSDAYRSRRIID